MIHLTPIYSANTVTTFERSTIGINTDLTLRLDLMGALTHVDSRKLHMH